MLRAGQWPEDLSDAARVVLSSAITVDLFMEGISSQEMVDLLTDLGPGSDPVTAASVHLALVAPDDTGMPVIAELERLTASDERLTRRAAWQWLTIVWENVGQLERAIEAARESIALAAPSDPPSYVASMRSLLAQLLLHVDRGDEAVLPARQALATFVELDSTESVAELRALLVMIDLWGERTQDAAAAVAQWPHESEGESAAILPRWVRAELEIRLGRVEEGLAEFRQVLTDAESWFPHHPGSGATSPWVAGAVMGATTAHALHAEDPGEYVWLATRCEELLADLLAAPRLDYPLTGALIFSLAAWRVLVDADVSDAVGRLMVLARGFGHGLSLPTLSYDDLAARFETTRPGVLEELSAGVGEQTPAQLREAAIAGLAQLG